MLITHEVTSIRNFPSSSHAVPKANWRRLMTRTGKSLRKAPVRPGPRRNMAFIPGGTGPQRHACLCVKILSFEPQRPS
jgi:hypothetical protein